MDVNRCVDVVVGLQWGSEGKGKLAAMLAGGYDYAVRVGGPNAGHTFHHLGQRYVCQAVPCAFINPNCTLLIGAGAVIDAKILADEVSRLEAQSGFNIRGRLMIDRRAAMILEADIAHEKNVLTHIGSTVHGVGRAVQQKIARMPMHATAGNLLKTGWCIGDVTRCLGDAIARGHNVMVEGTQGALLALDHGDYPYVTSKNTITSGILGDCGIGPGAVRDVYGVMRTYPIRVGGNSGPMGVELEWPEIARRAGLPTGLEERTTVTGRVRRVAELDPDRLSQAARLCTPTKLFVTFLDYLDGKLQNSHGVDYGQELLTFMQTWPLVGQKLAHYATCAKVPVWGVSWGALPEQSIAQIPVPATA